MEDAMRRVLGAATVLALATIGYLVMPISAQSSGDWPVTVGERVRLSYPGSDSVKDCTIAAVRNDFVRCAPEQNDTFAWIQTRDEWFNLRTLRSLERLSND